MKRPSPKRKAAAVKATASRPKARSSMVGGGYEATRPSRHRSWFGGKGIASEEMVLDEVDRERGQAVLMDMSRNNPVVRGIITTQARSVVGAGMNFQALSGDERYDLDLAALMEKFAENPEPTGRFDLADILRWQCSYVPKISGDGALLKLGKQRQVQPIEGHRIGNGIGKLTVDEGSKVQNGVVVDTFGRPTAYLIGQRRWGILQNVQPWKAEDVVHIGARFDRIDQYRSSPQLLSCVHTLIDLDELDSADLIKRKAIANLAVFFKTKNPRAAAKAASGMLPSRQAEPVEEDPTIKDLRKFGLSPGMAYFLGLDEDVTTLTPPSAGGDDGLFMRHMRKVAAASGVPAEVILMALGDSSFSASQALLLHFGEFIADEQANLIAPWKKDIIPWLIEGWIASGQLAPPKRGANPFAFRLGLRSTPWINRKDEIDADERYLNIGATTRQDICQKFNKDYKEVTRATVADTLWRAEQAFEANKRLRELGQPEITYKDLSSTARVSVSANAADLAGTDKTDPKADPKAKPAK